MYYENLLASQSFFASMYKRDKHLHETLYRAFYFCSTGDGVKKCTDRVKFEEKLVTDKNNGDAWAKNWRLEDSFEAGKMKALGDGNVNDKY